MFIILELIDGGTEDNTGLAATIYGLQQKGIHKGNILAFSNSDGLGKVFEDYEGIIKFQPLFSGNGKDIDFMEYNGIQIKDVEVETVHNELVGITKGSKYRIVYVNVNAGDDLLPYCSYESKRYIKSIEKITKGMREWIESPSRMNGLLKRM